MANTNLTVDQVTNRAQMVLHQKLNFIGNINRQYDDSYKTGGAKGGESVRIKLPNEFIIRTGAALSTSDVTQTAVTLTTGTQKGVDMVFTSQELTQDISLFSENYIEPAMSVLAANLESDALSMYKLVYTEISDLSEDPDLRDILDMGSRLTENLTPYSDRCLLLRPRANAALIDALKGLFNPDRNLDKNYREGQVANNFVGFQKVFENTLLPNHVGGSDDGTAKQLAPAQVIELENRMNSRETLRGNLEPSPCRNTGKVQRLTAYRKNSDEADTSVRHLALAA